MRILLLAGAAALVLAACGAPETEITEPEINITETETAPSPAPVSNPTKNAYFGDLHVHTGNSFDAFAFGVRRKPDDAYRFAKGQPIPHDGGYEIQLDGPPLDFLAVTDHGEYLGIVPAMADPDSPLSETETAKGAFGENAAAAQDTFLTIGRSFVLGNPIDEINDQTYMNSIWAKTVDAAERHNKPGEFTTFAGYEFTAMRMVSNEATAAANLHRNVIFRGSAPQQLFSTLNSPNPEDLWDWMDAQRANGHDALAIPHNSNASNGEMFASESYTGDTIDKAYIDQRRANEPIIEITQIKGTSETHPMLSPNDEWAGFEQYEYFIGSPMQSTVNDGDFARPALSRGIAMEREVGANPYEFGFIGSSDTHIAAATLKEETHWGKFPTDGASPEARNSVPANGAKTWDASDKRSGRVLAGSAYSASGLAGVWAEENTREAIFDAMRRKETFGTTGPRMKVRFFAGDYGIDALESANLAEMAYANGVPMGAESLRQDPTFIAWAMRDAGSAPLERLQIIKVWEEDGAPKEAIYDVACASGVPDASTHSCPAQEATVDTTTCEVSGEGRADLKAVWKDPDALVGQHVAYYVRVLEVPTCRWSTWDAVRNGSLPNPRLDLTIQERAWSSPIWVRN